MRRLAALEKKSKPAPWKVTGVRHKVLPKNQAVGHPPTNSNPLKPAHPSLITLSVHIFEIYFPEPLFISPVEALDHLNEFVRYFFFQFSRTEESRSGEHNKQDFSGVTRIEVELQSKNFFICITEKQPLLAQLFGIFLHLPRAGGYI